MQVTIDGVPYEPVCTPATSRIGIAISTHNRAGVLSQALEHQFRHLPAGALVVVVDDGSQPPAVVPASVKLIRRDKSLGIVASKNASLTALMDAGCEHLFLWDDDAWPISDGWWLPYIESPEPHLVYQFLDLAGARKLNDIAVLYRDDQHIAYTGQRGVMLYYHRSAIERVGGFDPIYGRGMYEHSDLALRIHNAGLTSWAFADVVGSEKLIHSLDEHELVERSVPRPDREEQEAGDLTIVKRVGQDTEEVAEYVSRIHTAELLDKIGIDPSGVGQILDALIEAEIPADAVVGVSQGWRLGGAIKTTERKLAEGVLVHAGQPMMAWCVGNARVEPKGNAILITKQASGKGKIDPLMALFNAVSLMALNPEAKKQDYQVHFI